MALTGGDHWAHFGDGNSVQIIDAKDYIDKESGNHFFKFIFMPSQRVVTMYGLESDLDDNGMIIKQYKFADIIWLERGVTRSRCWVVTDFDGGETPASRRDYDLRELLVDNERLLRSAEAAKNRAYYTLKQERVQIHEAIRSQVNILRELQRAKVRASDDDGGESIDMDMGE